MINTGPLSRPNNVPEELVFLKTKYFEGEAQTLRQNKSRCSELRVHVHEPARYSLWAAREVFPFITHIAMYNILPLGYL
jgi:hypothetical protein